MRTRAWGLDSIWDELLHELEQLQHNHEASQGWESRYMSGDALRMAGEALRADRRLPEGGYQ
jgi:negative regulator of sigma E activity